jgi:hypothetical protein
VYTLPNEVHDSAAASNGPGPGPLLSSAECTSGGAAIQIGAVVAGLARLGQSECRERKIRRAAS